MTLDDVADTEAWNWQSGNGPKSEAVATLCREVRRLLGIEFDLKMAISEAHSLKEEVISLKESLSRFNSCTSGRNYCSEFEANAQIHAKSCQYYVGNSFTEAI